MAVETRTPALDLPPPSIEVAPLGGTGGGLATENHRRAHESRQSTFNSRGIEP